MFKICVKKIYRHPKDTDGPSELAFVLAKPIAFIQCNKKAVVKLINTKIRQRAGK